MFFSILQIVILILCGVAVGLLIAIGVLFYQLDRDSEHADTRDYDPPYERKG